MDRLQTLEVFVCVADAGSFAQAARQLGLSAPSVTRGVNALEERLGARLFTRTTRQVRLTEVGRAYLEDARLVLTQLQTADDLAAGAATNPTGLLRITCSNEFGRIYIMPILTEFLEAHPSVEAEVQMIDRIVNIVEEGYDIAVRIGALPSSGLSAVRVGHVRRVTFGSPSYLEQYGTPLRPVDLLGHKTVAIMSIGNSVDWRFGPKMKEVVRLKPRLVVNSIAAGIETVRSGWGISRALSYQIGPDLETGHLKTVLENYEPEPLPIHLVHIEGRRAAAKVRSFLDFAAERLRANKTLNG